MAVVAGAANAAPAHLIPGRVPLDWQGPDGNTVVLDAPGGLIVIDTGRSPKHAQAILDYSKQRRRPIAAIVNTHWHLDHTTGNDDIRRAYPNARVYASTAIEGALFGFLGRGRAQTDKALADPKTSEGQKA
ncbi:MAG: MBL fold metallo-hydrolase, partial [Bradyrhizobium sp.]|nr:MBL fold metallo-hydrolase [Bradyrhizobium sp.]